ANGNPTGSSCNIAAASTASGGSGIFVPEEFPKMPCSAPDLPRACAGFGGLYGPAPTYSPKGELLSLPLKVFGDGCGITQKNRTFTNTFNALGQQTFAGINSDESGSTVPRNFNHSYVLAAGTYTRTGPDMLPGQQGVQTFVQLDTADRVTLVRRGPSSNPIVKANYTYNNFNLLTSIVYGNLAATTYQYDLAHRLTQIAHKNASGGILLQMDYTYTADDLPLTITESGALSGSAVVTYTYENRRRLIHEVRSGATPYDLAYEYDAGGNRTVKTDATDPQYVLRTEYTYDTSSHATYGSNNNRLESYKVFNTSLPGNPGDPGALLSTTWYYYTREWGDSYADIGNVTRIVTKPEASTQYSAVRFGYGMNDRTLTHVVGETWEWSEDPLYCPTNYSVEWAREFRYDGARARYLNRQLDPVRLESGSFVSLGDTWTDYDGDSAYGDFEVTPGYPPTVADKRSYQPGFAQVDPWMASGATATDYVMSDHLGTTRGLIDPDNVPTDAVVYTAFGERISGTNHRFGYVGSFGYQSQAEFPFLHVGARYYDPSSGRFLQRDPIGIAGGPNVYTYTFNIPSIFIDEDGLSTNNPGGAAGNTPAGVRQVAEIVKDMGNMAGNDAAKAAQKAAIKAAQQAAAAVAAAVAAKKAAEEAANKEHTKNARESTKDKHQKGESRRGKDKWGGEKGDCRRPYRRK
ncbi:MAG: RHS repeat-associated core domain-containing protein, partial [Phycisphaerales bacterium]|nr:RHS repeat-associated core domain-containing protein [Phycisphaerales bacterium]